MKLPIRFKPTKHFIDHVRTIYLSAFKEKFGVVSVLTPHPFKYFFRGLVVGVAFMIIVSGSAVYADQQNIGVENVLYPLKRSYETLNLQLTSSNELSLLHFKYAERRLEEIEETKQINPQSHRLVKLAEDFENNLVLSLEAIPNGNKEEEYEESEIDKHDEDKTIFDIEMVEPVIRSSPDIIVASSGSSILSMPQTPPSVLKKPNMKVDKSGSGKSDIRNKKSKVCNSFQELIDNHTKEVNTILARNLKALRRFETKCNPIINAVELKIEHLKSEIED
ncbi:hypothetical protein HY967_02210 [Candidatus Jorgensenbacteria bacterium]|nr:hypothetical protein [Candidatus Jorgensenbacteria bacterium]